MLSSELAPVGAVEAQVSRCSLEGPSSFVDEDVMMTAEQDQIVDAGNATVGPMVEVMDIAPMREPIAPGEDTSQVPGANRGS